MLRSGFKARLMALITHPFSVGDFTYDAKHIRCGLVEGSIFAVADWENAKDHPKTPGGFRVVMRPGSVMESESILATSETEITEHFQTWLYNLADEVNSMPEHRRILDVEEALGRFQERMGDLDEKARFNEEEVAELRQMLERLEADFDARIAALENSDVSKTVDLMTAKSQIETLDKLLNSSITKTRWFTALAARISDGLASAGGRALLETAMKVGADRMLPDNGGS